VRASRTSDGFVTAFSREKDKNDNSQSGKNERTNESTHPPRSPFFPRTSLRRHVDVVAALFDGGAAPNARDINERTALHHAAMLNAGGGVGEEVRSIHWSPYDRVGDVDADP
jgi:ankyrin repeat protein